MASPWTRRRMQKVFGLDVHQVRHLVTTFTPACIAREFLIAKSDVIHLRMDLGLPKFPRTRRHGINGYPAISAWRSPEWSSPEWSSGRATLRATL